MAHPDGLVLRQALEERAGLRGELRAAELRHAGALDGAAEVLRHQLHAVADAEHGHAELEQLRVDLRRVVGVDRRRPAAQDQRERAARTDAGRVIRVGDELGVDPALPHPPGDQLRVLAAEVDDEHGALLLAGPELDDLGA